MMLKIHDLFFFLISVYSQGPSCQEHFSWWKLRSQDSGFWIIPRSRSVCEKDDGKFRCWWDSFRGHPPLLRLLLLEFHPSVLTEASGLFCHFIMPQPSKRPFSVLIPKMSGGSAFTSEEGSVTCGEVVEHASLVLEGLGSVSSTDLQVWSRQNLLSWGAPTVPFYTANMGAGGKTLTYFLKH